MFKRVTVETLAGLITASGQNLPAVRRSETVDSRTALDRPEYWLQDALGGGPTLAGVRMSATSAMQLPTVNACVGLISDCGGVLPFGTYEEVGRDAKQPLKNHWLYPLLHDQPNAWMTSIEWVEMMVRHMLLRPVAYSYLDRMADGSIKSIIPLHPDCVTIIKAHDGTPYYWYRDDDWELETVIKPEHMFKLRWRAKDRYNGITPLGEIRETLGKAAAQDQHSARMFANGTRLSGILKYDGDLLPEEKQQLRYGWDAEHQGVANAFKTALLDKGWDFKPIGMSAVDAQTIEQLGYTDTQIMSVFRVPPHMISHTTKSTSWGTGVEQMSIGFVTYTMMPVLKRFEQAVQRDMIAPTEERGIFARFNTSALLRGDVRSRYLAYGLARQWGFFSVNDIRALEDMPGIGPEGDIYLSPLNMTPADSIRQMLDTDEPLPAAA